MFLNVKYSPKKRYGDFQPRKFNYNQEFPGMNHQAPFGFHHGGMPKFDVPPFPGAQFNNNGPRNNQRSFNGGKPNPVKKDYNNEPYFHENKVSTIIT